jgi:hypothetical protein
MLFQALNKEYCVEMNASSITHGLKQVGFGQGMLLGIIVIGASCWFLGDEKRRKRVIEGLLG